MTKYYIDSSGKYLGGFDGAPPPAGAVEVPTAPSDASHKWTNGAWVPSVSSLKARVSAKRYAVEIAGINFTYRTVPTPVSTSRETRASMIGVYTKANEGRWVEAPATENPFKFGDDKFRPATTQEVLDIYRAVETHVDVCYAIEAKKLAEIDATGTTNIDTGWPATANG